jgi:hypothetical protein
MVPEYAKVRPDSDAAIEGRLAVGQPQPEEISMQKIILPALFALGLGLAGASGAAAAPGAAGVNDAAKASTLVERTVLICKRITVCHRTAVGRVCQKERVCRHRW